MIYIAMDAKSQKSRGWVKCYLESHKYEYTDIGAQSSDDTSDITEIIPKIANMLNEAEATAIVACGNGAGVSIGLNRYKGLRAVLAADPTFAEWGKVYDNCNALCFADWSLSDKGEVANILDAWFSSTFKPLPRRVARIKGLDELG